MPLRASWQDIHSYGVVQMFWIAAAAREPNLLDAAASHASSVLWSLDI
jgi:hypothetical protein